MPIGSTTRRRAAATDNTITIDRNLVALVLVAIAIAYYGSIVARSRPDRPVVRWIASVAKQLLWVAAFAERAPQEQHFAVAGKDDHAIDHREGW